MATKSESTRLRRWFKWLMRVSLVLCGLVVLYLVLLRGVWFPGVTPTQTARILAQDEKFGFRALGMSHFWGDRILEPLREASQDFRDIRLERNAFWIAAALAKNKSARCDALALELFKRDEITPKLMGAIGLAAHGTLPNEAFRPNGSLQRILAAKEHVIQLDARNSYVSSAPLELALIAAKHARNVDSVEDIVTVMKANPVSHVQAAAADALGAIGDPRAAAPLAEAMRRPDFHALKNAFRALVALSDNRAIPLAIERIEVEDKNDLVVELEKVTWMQFGVDQNRWRDWWVSQASSRKPN